MTNIYLTADVIAAQSGGGQVTYQEAIALSHLGQSSYHIIDRNVLLAHAEQQFMNDNIPAPDGWGEDPWCWDNIAHSYLCGVPSDINIAHVYAGTFSRTVDFLKKRGAKVTYTAAAHDKDLSRSEHEKLGIPFQYPHLVEPVLWQRYLAGYLAADVLVTPSRHSADVMRRYGYTGRIEIITHGCYLPERVAPLPERFVTGYLGAIGPDKGLRYLLEAWRDLNYQDGSTLLIGGAHSESPYLADLIKHFCKNDKNIQVTGWLDNVSDFYDQISLYVQPSVTEGFGIEVIEALAHGRVAVASTGCGASDLIPEARRFTICNPKAIASVIDRLKKEGTERLRQAGLVERIHAEYCTWDKIHQRYLDLWKSL